MNGRYPDIHEAVRPGGGRTRVLLEALLLLAVFAAWMAGIQFATHHLPDNDGYYHIRMAALMREQGLIPDFPWLPLTILNPQEYSDHHFLYHVALMPFTLADLRLGAKWSAVVLAALAFLAIWWLLRGQGVRHAHLWAVGLLATSDAFLFRMSVTRAQSLSLGMLALGMHWLLQGRTARLAALAFLYVWTYDGFPLLAMLGVAHAAAVWLAERRFYGRALAAIAAGTVLGLVVNPYVPRNVVFLYRHLMPKLLSATAISVGSEWFPYDTGQLLANSSVALAAFVAGALMLGLAPKRTSVATATSFLVAALFGLMLFRARRFIEYAAPFSLVFAALAWSALRSGGEASRPTRRGWAQVASGVLAPGVLVVVLLLGMADTYRGARASIRRSAPFDLFAGASGWLERNTPEGEPVFQTDWDDFPRLFFYNTTNTYLVGLDPTYLQLQDPDLYDRWVAITQGRVENPSRAIREEFGARYVVSDLRHTSFIERAEEDPAIRWVYRDEESVVYEIGDGPG